MSVRCFMVPKFHSYRFSLIKNRVCVFSLFIESAYLFQIRVGIKVANNTKDSFTFVCTWEFDRNISGSIPKKTQGIAVVILVRAPSEANKTSLTFQLLQIITWLIDITSLFDYLCNVCFLLFIGYLLNLWLKLPIGS